MDSIYSQDFSNPKTVILVKRPSKNPSLSGLGLGFSTPSTSRCDPSRGRCWGVVVVLGGKGGLLDLSGNFRNFKVMLEFSRDDEETDI